jgi:hypothetical protein
MFMRFNMQILDALQHITHLDHLNVALMTIVH